jgi:hypothetical protein
MRTIVVVAMLAAVASVAHAQPGNGPPPPPVYAPPPPPPPPAYGYGGYQQPQPITLSADDQRILARGEITQGEHFGGVLVGFFLGFGSGQAVQGRWSDTGWIFTVGEAASVAAIMVGIGDIFQDCIDSTCHDDNENGGLFAVGIIGLVGFRVWEIVDSVAGPSSHNRKLHDIQMRMGYSQPGYYSIAPFVAPTHGGGGIAGVTFRF